MVERGIPRRSAPRSGRPRTANPGDRTTVIVTRPTPGDGLNQLPPTGPFGDQTPRENNPNLNNRLAQPPAARELTVHPAEGPVPVQFGGPLRVGGFPIYYRHIGQYWFVDFAVGEGPVESLASFRWGDKSNGQLNILVEAHLGVSGDTTSTLINAFESTYSIPEYVAHVVCRFPAPTQTTGQYNPFDFTVLCEGRVLYNPLTAATEFNGFPVSAAYDALTNPRQGNIGTSKLNAADWADAETGCEFDIGGGVPRWEIAMRIDQQDTLENWVKVLLSYAHGRQRYVDGKYGVYLELARDMALDNNSEPIFFTDMDAATENVSAEITFVQKGVDEVPTVVVVDYTEIVGSGIQTAWLPASVQVPAAVTGDWIEKRVSMPGIMSGERATRWGTTEYNVGLLDKDITIPAWQTAMIPLVGDRVRCRSARLVPGWDWVPIGGGGGPLGPPNATAIDGWEEVVITDIKLGDSPVVRAGLYRDATYGDAIDPPAPPNPPDPPPDPDSDPPCPTDLAAPNADPSEYGQIEFTPDPSPLISYYRVYDLFSGTPVLLTPTIDHTHPVGGDGKIHVTYPTAVHVDITGTHLNVRVSSVSFAGNEAPSCSSVSWDVTEPTSECCTPEGFASLFYKTNVGTTSYTWDNYTKIISVDVPATTDVYGEHFVSRLRAGAKADVLVLPGNAAGVMAPVRAGWYHVTAGARWADNATGFRALALFYLNGPGYGSRGLHAGYLTIDAGGSSYTTGQLLTVTGGTLMTDGLPFVGTIVASGGSITGLTYTGGLGYTAVPTIGVAGAGSGSTITAHLSAAFATADINMDCGPAPTANTLGRLIKEDVRMAVTTTSLHTTNEVSVDMLFTQGSGLLLGVQQSSGGNLSLLDGAPSSSYGQSPQCRVSLFRISDVNGASDTNIICDVG